MLHNTSEQDAHETITLFILDLLVRTPVNDHFFSDSAARARFATATTSAIIRNTGGCITSECPRTTPLASTLNTRGRAGLYREASDSSRSATPTLTGPSSPRAPSAA